MLHIFEQAASINEQFRNQIRRRQIAQKMQAIRDHYMHFFSQQLHQSGQLHQQMEVSHQNRVCIKSMGLEELARMSCTEHGAGQIVRMPLDYLKEMVSNYIMEPKNSKTQLQLQALIVLKNSLAVINKQDPHTFQPLHFLSIEQQVITSLKRIGLENPAGREHISYILFCIVHNCDPSGVAHLLERFNLIDYFVKVLLMRPSKAVCLDTFACIYLAMRKLQFAEMPSLAKINKYLLIFLKQSDEKYLETGLLCFSGLLRSLPGLASDLPNVNATIGLVLRLKETSSHKIKHILLSICGLMAKSENDQVAKQTLVFVDSVLATCNNSQVMTLAAKVFYGVILNYSHLAREMFNSNKTLLQRTVCLLENPSTDTALLSEICCCVFLLCAKSSACNFEFASRNLQRIEKIMASHQLDPSVLAFLSNSFKMIDFEQEF